MFSRGGAFDATGTPPLLPKPRSMDFPGRRLRLTLLTLDADKAAALEEGWHESAIIGPYSVTLLTIPDDHPELPDEKPFRVEDR